MLGGGDYFMYSPGHLPEVVRFRLQREKLWLHDWLHG